MPDEPCPRCGPLADRIRELELALADVTDQLTETAKRVEELEQALAEAQAKAVQWVSVEERSPENEQDVLVVEPNAERVRCAWWDGDPGWELFWVDELGQTTKEEITHWAPLPKPPEEGTG